MSRWAALFAWRETNFERRVVAEDLSVHGCPRETIPDVLQETVTKFRRLRHDQRESALRTYYFHKQDKIGGEMVSSKPNPNDGGCDCCGEGEICGCDCHE